MKRLGYAMLTKEVNFATCECPEAHQRPCWGRLAQITRLNSVQHLELLNTPKLQEILRNRQAARASFSRLPAKPRLDQIKES